MLTVQNLADAFSRNLEIIQMQTAGLTNHESLIQLPFRANCLNWVVGHILTNRYAICELLGGKIPRPEIKLDRYERESDPIQGPGEGVFVLSELLTHLEASQQCLEETLSKETEESLQRPGPKWGNSQQSVSFWLLFYYFHDCYHVGQTEILRQAAGKDDKII
jgi:uncharacterized damage-inducible protein DinB